MKKQFLIVCIGALLLMLMACGNNSPAIAEQTEASSQERKPDGLSNLVDEIKDPTDLDGSKLKETDLGEGLELTGKMTVDIGDYSFTVTLENNEAVNELIQMIKEAPLELELEDYSGFEKVGSLGRSLTRSDVQTTTVSGDIVLYNGNNIVLFYGSNSWSYTPIGKIDDLTDWEKALGSGNVNVTFSLIE